MYPLHQLHQQTSNDTHQLKARRVIFNYLLEHGAITFNVKQKRYGIDAKIFIEKISDLGAKLLEIYNRHRYLQFKEFADVYGQVSKSLPLPLARQVEAQQQQVRPNYTVLELMKMW